MSREDTFWAGLPKESSGLRMRLLSYWSEILQMRDSHEQTSARTSDTYAKHCSADILISSEQSSDILYRFLK